MSTIDYDQEMDRFYIPVNSRYEIQTKGKGSSFRIAKTDGSNERWLITDERLHAMLEDLARGTNAELYSNSDTTTISTKELEELRLNNARYMFLRNDTTGCGEPQVFDDEDANNYLMAKYLDSAIDKAIAKG